MRPFHFLIPFLCVAYAAPTTTAPCTCKSLATSLGKTSTRTVTGSASCTGLKLKPTCPTSTVKTSSTKKSSSSTKISSTTKKTSSTSTKTSTSSVKTSTSSAKTSSSSVKTSTSSIKISTSTSKPVTSSSSVKTVASSTLSTTTLKTSSTSSVKPSTSTSATTLRTSTTSSSPSSSSTCVPTPTGSAGKRGLSYNDATLTQLFSLSCGSKASKVNWAYNWWSGYYASGTPQSGLSTVVTYIPMLWSAASDLTSIWNTNVQTAIAAGTDAVLAFNEPDGCSDGGSCMDIPSAVAGYKQWLNPLAGQVRLGAPAITNGGSPMGLTYLSNFLGNCTSCQVDFIPIHWYSDASQIADFKSQVQNAYSIGGGRPLWITEFGCTSGTEAQIETFMKAALTWLDGLSYVERYAWFMDGPGYLVNSNGSGLSPLGLIYDTY